MKTVKRLLILAATVIILCVISVVASAETYGDLTYEVYNNKVKITDCNENATTVTIPAAINGYPVTVIEFSAFYECRKLTSITIPDSVRSIEYGAFEDCSSLTSITIPDSVTYIGINAFSGCTSLTNITISGSVTSIGDRAFRDCTSLTSITIPVGVTSIGSYTFYGCSSLTSITIPDSVTSIGSYAFYGCSGLTSITIPDSVTYIGSNAFNGCTSLTSITIPNSVRSIEYGAFEDCSSLTSINIPEGVTTIGDSAFSNCTNLTSITIPGSVTSIDNYAFRGCTSLTSITIPGSVTSIGDRAFRDCTSLTSITIPDSVTSIGDSAFYNCTNLTSITILGSVTSIGHSAFSRCSSLTSITIPDSVRSIGGYAFNDCTSLETVTIPNGVTSIGSSAFDGCSAIKKVYAASAESWLNISFENYSANPLCSGGAKELYFNNELVTDLVIPDGVKSISSSAFYRCTSLTNVTIPGSVTSIGEEAFYGCSAIKKVYTTSAESWLNISFENYSANPLRNGSELYFNNVLATDITIPVGVTSIGEYAFYNCTSLTSVTIPDSVTSIGSYAFSGCTSLTSVTIPDSVTSIGNYAFSRCSSLTSITIPDNVTSIGSNAFNGCSSLTSVRISGSVTSISEAAFYGCTSLTSVTIPDSVTYIGGSAFSVCTSLISITIPGSVASIGSSAFSNCSSLTSVTIPDSVTSISKSAFEECTSLTSATISEGVKSIGYSAFRGCTSLTSINIPEGVTTIGAFTFYGCTSLTSINIPEGVTTISQYTFCYCSSLTSITIPDSVRSIEYGAFGFCYNLKYVFYTGTQEQWNNITKNSLNDGLDNVKKFYNVDEDYNLDNWTLLNRNSTIFVLYAAKNNLYVLPSTVRSIEQDSFRNADTLHTVIMPESLKNIGAYAFYDADELTCVYIPASVTTIDQYAFYGCDNLTDVYYGGTQEQWAAIRINSYNSDLKYATLHFSEKPVVSGNAVYNADKSVLICYNNEATATSFSVPSTVRTIGTRAFKNNTVLKTVSLDSVTAIGNDAFLNCTSLKRMTIPDSVTSLGEYAFCGCKSLQSVSFGTGIKTISKNAFYGCESLADISFTESLETICNYAFYGCNSLVTVEFPKNLGAIGDYAFYGCSKLENIRFSEKINSKLRSLGANAFAACSSVEYVYLPDGLASMGKGTFKDCTKLERVYLPENGITTVPADAFRGCSFLEIIFIPASVNAFGDSAFLGCSNLSDIYFGGTQQAWDDIEILSSNSVIWAADVHAEHTHTFSFRSSSDKKGYSYYECSVCDYVRLLPHKYTINYYANGGKGEMAPSVHTYDTPQELSPVTYTILGQKLLGWATEEGSTEVVYTDAQSVLNLTDERDGTIDLYAVWSPITYSVKYNANGGNGTMANSTHTFGVTQALTANTYTRTGYVFLGWARSKSATTPDYVDCKEVSGLTGVDGRVVNLYAVWKPNTFYVAYNANGGKGTMENSTHTFGTPKALTANAFTRTGYTFLGWAKSKSATTPDYVDGKSVSGLTGVDGRVVNLYAVWKANTFYVAYNANGGKGTMANSTHTFGVTQALTANTYTRTGYVFLGWARSKSATTPDYVDCKEVSGLTGVDGRVVNLYAVWKPNTFYVAYNANGGKGAMENSTHTFGTAQALTANTYTRTGYVFLGWAKSKSATTPDYVDCKEVSGLTGVDGRVVNLYAVWKPNTFYVAYNANGGKGTMENSTHTFGVTQALTANTYTRTGYVFLGWARSKSATTPDYVDCKEVSGLTGVDGRVVNLYAVWQPISYSVRYNANGGTGTMADSNHTYGTGSALSANTFTRTGYTFLGWAKSKSATTPDYVDCKSVSGLTGVQGKVVNLYAVWQKT